jgi:hypothetical protein
VDVSSSEVYHVKILCSLSLSLSLLYCVCVCVNLLNIIYLCCIFEQVLVKSDL